MNFRRNGSSPLKVGRPFTAEFLSEGTCLDWTNTFVWKALEILWAFVWCEQHWPLKLLFRNMRGEFHWETPPLNPQNPLNCSTWVHQNRVNRCNCGGDFYPWPEKRAIVCKDVQVTCDRNSQANGNFSPITRTGKNESRCGKFLGIPHQQTKFASEWRCAILAHADLRHIWWEIVLPMLYPWKKDLEKPPTSPAHVALKISGSAANMQFAPGGLSRAVALNQHWWK